MDPIDYVDLARPGYLDWIVPTLVQLWLVGLAFSVVLRLVRRLVSDCDGPAVVGGAARSAWVPPTDAARAAAQAELHAFLSGSAVAARPRRCGVTAAAAGVRLHQQARDGSDCCENCGLARSLWWDGCRAVVSCPGRKVARRRALRVVCKGDKGRLLAGPGGGFVTYGRRRRSCDVSRGVVSGVLRLAG